ncbi:MAG: hypothetical protein J6S71_04035 [Clostridia bacterium]|nr:hypothetical protein [Clostridia bacterium]
MRKTLALVLSVVMLLAACSFAIPVSAAPEGTAINTADEFMAMVSTPADATEPTAKYYLASDITLPGSYVEPFWGILDGNGKTVTVSAPMFNDFSGEVKNLTIKGDIYYADSDCGALAINSTKGFNATNCVNNANVTVTGNAKLAGGFVANCVKTEGPVLFYNCTNNGNVYIDSTADQKMRAGGFGGIIDSCVFINCTNNGDVYTKGNICIAGGFVARIALNVGTCTAEAYNCVNTGDIVVDDTYIGADGVSMGTGGSDAGGIFGYIGGKGNAGWYRIWGCRNDGKVDGPRQIGGMVGYVYASGTTAYVDIQFCINTGDIVYGQIKTPTPDTPLYDYASPFVAYTNSANTTIKYNINTGSIIKREGTICANEGVSFFGCSSADATVYDLQGNYVLNYDEFKYYSYANPVTESGKYAGQIHEISETDGILPTTLDDIKSGKVCYEIMKLAEADEYGYNLFYDDAYAAYGYPCDYAFNFYQKIGTDDMPSVDPAAGWVVLNGTTYANGEKTAPETTEAPETTKEPEQTTEPAPETTVAPEVENTEAPTPEQTQGGEQKTEEKKGCGGFVAGSVALVAILGTALIIKKRD